MSETLNDDDSQIIDGEKYEENENSSLQRYSRSKLYSLRNNERSQRRPDCASRCELQTLSFWKSSSGYERSHGGSIGNAGGDSTLSSGPIQSSPFSMNSTSRARERNVRDRQMGIIRAVCGPVESSFAHKSSPSQKASFLDQRTNSITHLMPAFAKKRMAAAAAQKTTPTTVDYSETQDNEESPRQTSNYDSSSRVVRNKEIPYEQQQQRFGALGSDISPRRSLNDTCENSSAGSGLNSRHSVNLHERRFGSGRLLPRDVSWDYHEKNNSTSQLQRPTSTRFSTERTNNSSEVGNYHENNSFERKHNSGRESYSSNTQHASNRRYNLDEKVRPQRHNNFKDKNDEPEWYSGGPTSQNDIIELRGFDEPTGDSKTELSSENAGGSNADLSQSSSNYELTNLNTASNIETDARSCTETPNNNAVVPAVSSDIENEEPIEPISVPDENVNVPQHAADMSKEFNFDAFLNLDSLDLQILHTNTNDQHNNTASSGSRFSRWFANSDTPPGIQDEKAPDKEIPNPKAGNVLEFFQNAKARSAGPQKFEMPSVEELEAKMRKVDMQDKNLGKIGSNEPCLETPESSQRGHTEDIEAFKKILQQLNDGSMMDTKREILQHESARCISPLKQALVTGFIPPEMSQNLPPPAPLMSVTPDNFRFASPMSPSQHIHMNNPNARLRHPRDVLFDYKKQIDFVNLVHAVNRGQIPLVFLEKELNNPNVPLPTKEVIAAVIHEIARSFSPVTPLLRRSPINQNQQSMHSPTAADSIPTTQMEPSTSTEIKPQALTDQMSHQSASSPMGMAQDPHIRSQASMQNAMIKKKMEETQMDQNRRHSDFNMQADNIQMQSEQQSPQHQLHIHNLAAATLQQSRHLNSPTPLAFTPTSVLRKMTADKDSTSSQTQHQQQSQQQQQYLKLLHETQNKVMNPLCSFLNQNPQQLPSAMPQPRMILGGNHGSTQMATTQQQPQQTQHLNQAISPQALSPMLPNIQHRVPSNEAKWQMNFFQQQQQQQALNKPMGRPILKGPPGALTMPLPQPVAQHPMHILGHLQHQSTPQPNTQVQVPPMIFPGKTDISQQQQQRLQNNQTPQHILNPQSQPQGFAPPQHLQQPIPQMPSNSLHMQHQQLFHLHHMTLQQQQHMQLQRQLHQQMHTQPTPQPQPQQQQPETKNRPHNFSQPQPGLSSPVNNVISNAAGSMVCPREGDLSPTSNQLAQWFSPELLAQASAGKLPQINMNQALSLEEFERNIQQHSSTVVHN